MTDTEYAELDLAVARAEIAAGQLDVKISDGGVPTIQDGSGRWETFRPSTSWTHGGPIIERERITLQCHDGGWEAYVDTEWSRGSDEVPQMWKGEGEGPTPLVAAMQAYVASRQP